MAKAPVSEEILKDKFGPHLNYIRPAAGETSLSIPRRSWSKLIAVFAVNNAEFN